MFQMETDRNLLFGILALQMDFVTRDDLITGMNSWILEKNRALGEILVERGALAAADRFLLEPLVRRHIEQHGDDPARSLASLSSVDWLRVDLASAAQADLDVRESLGRLKDPLPIRPWDEVRQHHTLTGPVRPARGSGS